MPWVGEQFARSNGMADVSRRMTCEIVVRQRWLETAHNLNAMRRNRLATKHVRAEKIIRARASQFRRDNATDVKAAQSNQSHPQWHWCRRAMVRHSLKNEEIDLQTLSPTKPQQARGGRKMRPARPETSWSAITRKGNAPSSSAESRAMTQRTASLD